MKKKASISITVLLLLVLAVSVVMAARTSLDHRKGAADYEEALSLASGEAAQASAPAAPAEAGLPSEAATLLALDLDALRQVNGEVLGWLSIPGAGISYPLMEGRDNSYYLNHTWRGNRSSVGSIFMECQCSRDFSDFNTIIYGHRVSNQSMFGLLHSYANQDFADLHPSFYITDAAGCRRYDIFAAYEAPVDSAVYRLGVSTDQGKEAVINEALAASVVATPIRPTSANQIATLSTCTGSGHANRWVVVGVLAAIE